MGNLQFKAHLLTNRICIDTHAMIPKKAGMEPNEIPTTIFYRLVYEPPIFTETVVHHPKEPNFTVNGGNDLPPFNYHGKDPGSGSLHHNSPPTTWQ